MIFPWAGAAVGSLTAAWIAEICARKRKPKAVQLTAYELDEGLADRLNQHRRIAVVWRWPQLRQQQGKVWRERAATG